MLKNKIIVRKIRNILILIMAMIVMVGAYRNIGRSRAEDVLEIEALALDNYGYLQDEIFVLEAKEIENDLFEIELPESINTKKINEIVKITLEEPTVEVESENADKEDALTENTVTEETEAIEIIDNKIYLTREEIETKQLNVETVYDVAMLAKDEQGNINKNLLTEKTEEERAQIEITEETEVLYSKVLKYEDKENAKLVEVKGYLPKDAQLQVTEVTQEQINQIFGDKAKIDVAYDIKIVMEVVTIIPADEANPTAEPEKIIETIEINPEEFEETCEVSIKDVNIQEQSKVYHVKEDNTYETVNVKENTEENITFDAQTFSIYAVGTDEGIMATAALGTFSPYSNTTWAKSHSLTITPAEGYAFASSKWVEDDTGETKVVAVGADDSSLTTTTPAKTGKWYLYVALTSNANGASTGILSGNFYVDVTAPVINSYRGYYDSDTSKTYTSGDWVNEKVGFYFESITENHSGVAKYQYSSDGSTWYTFGTASRYQGFVFTEGNQNRIVSNYYRVVDGAGNVSNVVPSSGKFYCKYDTIAPTAGTMAFNLGSATGSAYTLNNWTNQDVYLTLTNGTDTGNEDATLNSGHKSTTYTVNGTASTATSLTTSGTYSIVVTTEDNAENTSSNTYESVKIDKTKPTITVSPTGGTSTWYNAAVSTKITVADTGGSGLLSSNSYQYYLSNSDSALSGGSWTTYTSGTAFNLNPGTSGTYYLFVKRVKDNAGNTSTTNGTATTVSSTTYQRFGPYQFDYDKPTVSVSNQVISDGLIRDYNGYKNTSSGHSSSTTTWKDITGTNNGTITGATWGSDYLSFDGTDDWVNIGEVNVTDEITVEATIELDTVTTNQVILANYENGGLGIELSSTGVIGFYVYNASTSAYVGAKTTTALTAGTKYHVVGVFDGSSIKLYIDGALAAETAFSGTYGAPTSSTVMALGANPVGSTGQNKYFDGKIYSARVYNRALSATEVSHNYGVDNTIYKWHNSAVSTTITAADTGGSGLLSSNSYQYYLSTSSSALSGGSWTTYTSGTAFTMNPGTSGTYYLFVKRVKDNAGNTSTTNGTATTVSSTTYQRFGPYQFDYDNPSGNASASVLYTNQPSVTIYMNAVTDTGGSGISTVTMSAWHGSYVTHKLIKSMTWDSTNERHYATFTFEEIPNSSSGETGQGEGKYNFDGTVFDGAGNKYSPSSVSVIYDTTNPTITVSPSSTNEWHNSAISTTITVTDPTANASDGNVSGLSPDNEYEYFLSTTATPTSVPTGTTVSGTYTSGTAFDMDPGTSGEYYLFVRQVSDRATNVSTGTIVSVGGTNFYRYGKYKFDYEKPTISVSPASHNWTNSAVSATITIGETGGSGLSADNEYQYYLSTRDGNLEGGTWTDYTSGTEFDINPGISGTYYLFIKRVSDNAGNISTSNGALVSGLYQMFGAYKFDYEKPTITVSNDVISDGLIRNYNGYKNTANGHSISTTSWIDLTGTKNGTTKGGAWGSDYLTLDGTNDWVDLGQVSITDKITLEATIENDEVTSDTNKVILANYQNGGAGLEVMASGKLAFYVYNTSASSWVYITTDTAITAGTKYHVVGTFDGSSMKLYVNGVLEAENAFSGPYVAPAGNTVMAIGANPSGSTATGSYFNGKIYSARIYNKALNASEVSHNYAVDNTIYKWHNTAVNTTIKITETGGSGLLVSTDSYQYYLSTSSSALEGGTWTDYTSETAFELNPGFDGEFYLFVKRVTDNAGNISTANGTATTVDSTTYQMFGPYQFDYTSPAIEYSHQTTDVDILNKTYTMTFTATDDHYASGILTLDDLTILMQNGQLDENGDPIVYDLKDEPVTLALRSEEIVEDGVTLGHTYTLTISDLEQLEIKTGLTTADYSGIITVAVPAGKIVDLAGNTNIQTTITTGVDIPGGTGTGTPIDVVDPLWTKVSSSVDLENGTATLTIKGTDTYFDEDLLDPDEIIVFLNGTQVTSGITVNLSSATALTETRLVNGSTTTVQYGVQYTITVSDIEQDIEQMKIRIPSGMLVDESGNVNKTTDFILFNYLRWTGLETGMASPFLGNTNLKREDIEKVTFVQGVSEANSTQWDASAQGDNSIIAWYTDSNSNGAYEVYIGSDDQIYANKDSSYLFAYIGYGENCTATTTIANLNLLTTTSVTNMRAMFWFTGYRSMTSLDLGAFNTKNVTNMREMFNGCGYNAMTTFNLGTKFNTEKVTDMSWMFANLGYNAMTSLSLPSTFKPSYVTDMSYMFSHCGYTAMTTLTLPESFDTGIVEDMSYMFSYCGYTAMTTLTLPNSFDTCCVTNMESMFKYCGYTAMTSLELGTLFDTALVTNMDSMFAYCGYTALEELYLGEMFYTTNVTNMSDMFLRCGGTAMSILDLGPAFTKITGFDPGTFGECGDPAGLTIYVPESIYMSREQLKEESAATRDNQELYMPSNNNATLIPEYKPEWSVTGTAVTNTATEQKLEITLTGATNTYNYTSYVTTNLTADDITVYIDGTELTEVEKALTQPDDTTRIATATHTLTLTNFEEALRQAGKLYKEWSGNITLKIGGRGESTDTYTANILVDQYGNQSMMETDEGGTWVDVNFKDATLSTANTNGKLFADFIKPEIVYTYSSTDIDYDTKTVQVVFTIADKYYSSANLTVDDLTIMVDGVIPGDTDGDGTLETGETLAIERTLTSTNITATVDGATKTIGKQYTLTITEMTQDVEASGRSYLDYAGIVTVAIPAGKVADNSGNSNDAQTITIGVDLSPSIQETIPYLPRGFTYVEGTNLSNGLTIQDASGNRFVWVEVPRNTTVYDEIGIDIDLDSLTGTELTTAYNNIETELQEYAADYRHADYYDTWNSALTDVMGSETEYNKLKQNMLRSIYSDGGFYIGKYETGTTTGRTSSSVGLTTPVIQANVYPYNYVTPSQAQELASEMSLPGYTSSLMFGIQWDLVLKYLETKGATQEELKGTTTGSTTWGNYAISTYDITNTNATYFTGGTWQNGAYGEKASGTSVLLSTGADSQFSKQGIYDLAGNVAEFTLETNSNNAYTMRGGAYDSNEVDQSRANYHAYVNTQSFSTRGFRVMLIREPVIVDTVDPKWTIEVESGQIKLRAIDEYFKEATLTADDITVYVEGVENTVLEKDITTIAPVDILDTVDGVANTVVGKEYTLTFPNLGDAEGYVEFTPIDAIVGGTAKYKADNAGEISIEIAAGTIEDQSGNTSDVAEKNLGNFDATKLEVFPVQSTNDTSAKTETIIFNVTDRNYDKTDLIGLDTDSDGDIDDLNDELTIKIDGVEITDDINIQSLTYVEIKTTVDGVEKVVGHQYTLVLKDFVETDAEFIASGRDYRELSGTVSIEIAATAAKDTNGNNIDPTTTTVTGDYIDYINPDIIYEHSTSDIDATNNKYTMTFSVTDKYYTSGVLDLSDLTILMTNGQLDESGNEKIYNLVTELPSGSVALTPTAITKNVSVTNTSGTVETVTAHPIGHTYTLTISNLDQLVREDGDTTVNYSGVITVAIPANKVLDRTSQGNVAKTITSGVNITGDTTSGTPVEVDVVNPIWEKVSSSALAKTPEQAVNATATTGTATIKIQGTDTYLDVTDTTNSYDDSTLTSDEIEVYIDGTKNTTLTPTITKTATLTETRNVFGSSPTTTETVQYGVEYTITLNGWVQGANQVKIKILADAIKDETGNGNKETDIIAYNMLKKTNTEYDEYDLSVGIEKPFLGSAATIQRQNIENVTFLSTTATAPESGWWDVSAQGDNSIIAWATQTTSQQDRGVYTVCIASDYEIFANQDSTYLFACLGYSTNCTATETITGLQLLNTSSVTVMLRMFVFCGYNAMTSLALPETFDTSNVTIMTGMFLSCGENSMTSLTLSTVFNTSNVEQMQFMFYSCGKNAMTSLELPAAFNTESVKTMEGMFAYCGSTAMTTLDLGSNFDTSNVTNMKEMFKYCGYTAMTNLNLGTNFNTINVTDMSYMFNWTGYSEMTSISFGDQFNTTSVLDMSYMFSRCGYQKLEVLDLRPSASATEEQKSTMFNTSNVTNMSYMFNRCGYGAEQADGSITGLTNLYLGENFNTVSVGDMSYMFSNTGLKKLISLDLGDKFDTSSVTNMEGMFYQLGFTEMTSLDLGEQFNTANVTNMKMMFYGTGYTKLESLDLGDLFYTSAVNTTQQMFENCGSLKMEVLDLGPAFTKIPSTNTDMFKTCGKSTLVIYAPESIYKNINAFKLNSTDTTETPDSLKYTRGTINPKYRPEWTVTGTTVTNTTTEQKIEIVLTGAVNTTNYTSNVTTALTADDITVWIDGTQLTDVGKSLTTASPATGASITHTLTLTNFEESLRQAGKLYKEWSGNISLNIGGRGESTDTYTANVLVDEYGNQSMSEIDTTGTWIDIELKDETTSTANTNGKLFTDFIKPEFTYEYSETVIDKDTNTLTVVFYVADKYFDATNSAALALSDFYNPDTDASSDGKAVFQIAGEEININVAGNSLTSEALADGTGLKYTLVVKNLEQTNAEGFTDGYTHSGVVTISIPKEKFQDYSGNKSDAKTITIGIDDPTTGDGHTTAVKVDVVDPIWELGTVDLENGTIKLRAIDKYFSSVTIDEDDITVYVDVNGTKVEASGVQKQLTGPTDITDTVDGVANTVVGKEYTLKLSNLSPGGETEFDPTNIDDLEAETDTFKYKYKTENGGTISIEIATGTILDATGNTNKVTPLEIGDIDATTPAVWPVRHTQNSSAKTETIVFNVTDKNYYESDLIGIDNDSNGTIDELNDELTIKIDGVEITDDINIQSFSYVEIKTEINGVEKVVGHQYTLVLDGFIETDAEFMASGKDYRELSGTVSIEIAETASRDISGNTLDPTTTTVVGDYIDFINPDIRYEYSTSDIDTTNNKYTMTFTVTDKYYTSGVLSLLDLTILMTNGQRDANGNEKIYNLQTELPSGSVRLTPTAITKDVNLTDATTGTVGAVTGHPIGHTYTLTIENLDQLVRESDDTTVNYSGVITVAIAADKVLDRTGNGNVAKTITSGVNITGDTTSGTPVEVDVVNPIWEKVSSSALAKTPEQAVDATATTGTATIKIQGTDTYLDVTDTTNSYDDSTLTVDEIEVYIDGTKNTTLTPTITKTATLTETRNIFGSSPVATETVQYGVEYTITISGWVQNANQVKIKILADAIKDETGNGNKATEFIIYNCLESAATETEETSGFLDGNGVGETSATTGIARNEIQQVIFVNNLDDAPITVAGDGTITLGTNCWDVSAISDKSILAWTSQTSKPYTVYVGSNFEIFANQDARRLFKYIGFAGDDEDGDGTVEASETYYTATATETISNIGALNVSSVTDMGYMFMYCGYTAMTTLDLGDNFDTSNVTNMQSMFVHCGYTAMTTIDLGGKFDTTNVTIMNCMFEYCGYTAMTSLDLGTNFNTSNVTSMEAMFDCCGYTAMTSLELGDNFNTSNVTSMKQMFYCTGRKAMTSLDLSSGTAASNITQFNTSSVTNMEKMFTHCGRTAMTSFNLGTNFNTSSVTDMSYMFAYCGEQAMLSLDLGAKFDTRSVTNMTGMFKRCGAIAMTSLNLRTNFNTSNVTTMEEMFYECGYTVMTSLDLSSGTATTNTTQFNTSSVTNMRAMFSGCGFEKMTSLNLGTNFNTSNVTDMSTMFANCGFRKLTSLDLSSGTAESNTTQFNTSSVTTMAGMFFRCGYTVMTSLKLGTNFDTSNVTDMNGMFSLCGYTAMTTLDLGPAFVNIPTGTITDEWDVTYNACDDFVSNTGKSGECVIYAPESIYKNINAFKLNSTDTTETLDSLKYTRGTINPKYRPEWSVTGTTVTNTTTEQKIEIVLTGTVNTANYTSDVTTALTADDITVWIDGTQLTDVGKSLTTASLATGDSITHTLTLTNFEESVRRSGLKYTEWSGNITLKIAGRGESTDSYTANVLVDEYGNQSMSEIDTTGTWIDIELKDETTSTANTNGKLFTDFIKPEFTYEYSETVIDKDTNTLTVVFYVADKYFDATNSAGLALSDFYNPETDASSDGKAVFQIAGEEININVAGNSLTSEALADGIGLKHTLVVKNLEQTNAEGFADGYTYSGVVSITIPKDKFQDYSGNKNAAKTITIGADYPSGGLFVGTEYTMPYLPTGFTHVAGTNLNNGLTIQDSSGNQFVWVEVPRNTTVYDEVGTDLDLDSLGGTELTTALNNIETELQEYAVDYRSDTHNDTWSSEAATGIASAEEYNELKQKMLKSVYKNGGFYIGKYEAGTDTARTSTGDELTIPVVQANAYPYNKVTSAQAQEAASQMYSGEYTSSLMFGIQGDLILKYLETKGATQEELKGTTTGSTNWGNYKNSTYNITNTSAKYWENSTDGWQNGAYGEKTSTTTFVILSTGADSQFSKQGIYDLAGNVVEWTLEYSSNPDLPCVNRGGAANNNGNQSPARDRNSDATTTNGTNAGFRVALYKDEDPVIVDVVDPIWELGTVDLENGIIKLRAKDKYFSSVTIDEDDITVYVNGVPSSAVEKDITSTTPTEIRETVDGVENTLVGKEYTLLLSNIVPDEATDTTFVPTNLDELDTETRDTYVYKYKSENGGTISIEIATGTILDVTGNTNKATPLDVGNIDGTNPGIYEVRKTQDASGNTETIVFNVTDKNFDPSDLITKTEMSLFIDNVEMDELLQNATYADPIAIKTTVDGVENVTVGHQYTLVISNIAETSKRTGKDYLEWSGTLRLEIDAEAAKDITGNKTSAKTFTDFIDYLKPQLEQLTVTNPINTSAKTYTMSFNVIDKYLDTTDLIGIDSDSDGDIDNLNNELTIKVDGENATDDITWQLTYTPIEATMNKTVEGSVVSDEYTIGHTYTLILSQFEQATKHAGKDFFEWSGTVSVEIAGTAVKDTTGNNLASDPTIVAGEHVDFIQPKLEEVEPTATIIAEDSANKTETIVFNIMDKYLDTTNALETTEFTVYVDGEAVTVDYTNESSTGLDGVFTKVQDFTATVNGDEDHIVGRQYKLVLSNFEQATRNSNEYKDFSGTVSIKITTSDAVNDTSNNLLDSTNKTVTGDFVDYIKPDIEYTHQDSDVDTGNKKYIMTFDITDKYYSSGELILDDIKPTDESEPKIEILMQNGQLDGDGNPIIYNLKDEPVTLALASTPITKTFNKTVGGTVVTDGTYTIGHTYTLTISNLEQLEMKTGMTTSDYSGIITVSIDGDMIKDTSNNGNPATTITAGVDIEGGVYSGSEIEVDVVDPLWNKVSSSALAKASTDAVDATATTGTATITIRGTDTYLDVTDTTNSYDDSTLTTDEIEVYIDGTKSTTITPTITSVTPLTETRRVYNSETTETVQYGVEYTMTISGWAQGANQVKIEILEDAIKDETGNGNKATEFIIYNCLESSASERIETSGFLDGNGVGESGATTGIKRNEIQQVIFVESLDDAPITVAANGTITLGTNCWDVSAISDKSILAWTSQTEAPYTVYIGSDSEIFANQDASYLFAYIGFAGENGNYYTATATDIISNIGALNVSSVTNMQYMFRYTGYTKMTTLNLGTNFDTSNVVDMQSMFNYCGYTAMTSLNLGNNFNTSNVKEMSNMFSRCGYRAMTSLDLSSNTDTTNTTQFNTSSVTNMYSMFMWCGNDAMTNLNLGNNFNTSNVTDTNQMFFCCGYKAMTSLDLGDKFDTSSVTNMFNMFNQCGFTAMTSLDLGDKFDTSSVTNMNSMFSSCGNKAMTSLDLGDKFDTSSVTNMQNMFSSCGSTAMTSLDLGDKFDTSRVTNMNSMFSSCGNEAMTSLDLGDLFYTTVVTDMERMFLNCGTTAMTVLDLGPAFTKIPSTNTDMFTNCGTSTLVIYAPESIYSDRTGFKLNN